MRRGWLAGVLVLSVAITLLMVPGLALTRASATQLLIDGAAVGLSLASLAWAALFGVDPDVDVDAPGALVRQVNLVLIGMLFVLAVAVLTRQFRSLNRNARLAAELTRQRAQLAYQAFHDPLTGLANRALFAERLDAALESSVPSVLLIDLDGFKAVNDSRGHAAGDQLLVTVARRLRAAVGSADTVARMGGDEFAVLLPGKPGCATASAVAQRILDRVARPVKLGEATVELRVSVGVATTSPGAPADAVLRDADLALYRAKQEGKNRYRVADRELAQRSLDRYRLEEDVRAAVARDEFEAVYRPLVELATDRVVGAEAALRWRHPTRGLLERDEFADAALAVGLLTELDRRLLAAACAAAPNWLSDAPDLTMTVPVCAACVADPSVVSAVVKCLGPLRPGVLELAIPQAALVADIAAVERPLRGLADLGVGLGIADFGAGATDLHRLRTVPLRTLTLHRTLSGDPGLLQAVLGLADALALRAVVTGVSSRARLRDWGAEFAAFDNPVPAAEFAALLDTPRVA